MKNPLSAKTVVLGLQHTFVMFGSTVLVPMVTGLDIGVTLFAAGTGTLIFHVVTKFKVPVFLGSSFAFIPALVVIGESEGLPYALGGIVAAGGLYIIVAIIFMFVSIDVMHKIFPPHVTGPIIILIGIILAPVAIKNATDAYVGNIRGQISELGCWGIAFFTFAAGVFVKMAFPKWGLKFLSLLPVLFALLAGYTLAVLTGIVDFSAVAKAAWIGLPAFSSPKFSLSAISFTVPVAIVTMVEHFGDILAIGNVTGKDYLADPRISRTLLGDGIATSVAAFIGGPANTTYSENTGAVALTEAHDPAIMRIAAVFAILLSLVPKFSAIVGTIPAPVIGGISILLFGMISAIGIKNMVDARIDIHDPKILMTVAAMLVLGLGTGTISSLVDPRAPGAAISAGSFSFSGLGLAAIAGVFLNIVLNISNFKNK
ncbi:MAG: uracil-xanthine permease family protein [Spirochaetales bacterium]|jgi:uracil permease|nr:uracil-xanthine permease family protein [Spirochaetales bacterium]